MTELLTPQSESLWTAPLWKPTPTLLETLTEAGVAVHDRQPTMRKFARMQVCFHEAGHAVGFWEEDTRVDVLTVQEGWFFASAHGYTDPEAGQYYEWWEGREFEGDKEKQVASLVTTLAGRVAAERYEVEYGQTAFVAEPLENVDPVMEDYAPTEREAAKSAARGCESDMELFYDLNRYIGVSLSYAMGQTEQFVDRKWPKLIEVAELLYERGKLDGKYAKS